MNGGIGASRLARLLQRRTGDAGSSRRAVGGYTILEVMIVLAVTGMLFISAAILIAGRQRQAEFNQSIREVQSHIQQVINESSIGFYPNLGNFRCTVQGGDPPQFAQATAGQGTNQGCVFLGKAIQFGVTGTDPEQFRILTIAGRQKNTGGQEAANLAQAMPRAVASTGSVANPVDVSMNEQLLYGLQAVWADAGVVAFVNALGGVADLSGTGVQALNIIPVNNTQLGMSQTAAVQAVNNNLATSPQNPTSGVRVCFASGGTNQSGLITIGGPGRGLTVALEIKSNRDCS